MKDPFGEIKIISEESRRIGKRKERKHLSGSSSPSKYKKSRYSSISKDRRSFDDFKCASPR